MLLPPSGLMFQPGLPFIEDRFQRAALLGRSDSLRGINVLKRVSSANTINSLPVCGASTSGSRRETIVVTQQPERNERGTKIPLTLHDVPFVVAVVVAVGGPVVNVESLNRGVVVTRGTVLDGGSDRERLC